MASSVADRLSIRDFSVTHSVIYSEDVNSITETLKRFIQSFPKEVKRKDLQDLYGSLLTGKLEGSQDSDVGANALLALLFNSGTPHLDRLLGCDCLQQMAPQQDLCGTMISGELTCLASCLAVIIAQGLNDPEFNSIIEPLIRSIETRNVSPHIEQKILTFLCKITSANPHLLTSDQTRVVTARLVQLVTSNPNHSTSTAIKDPKVKKMENSNIIRELDGTISLELFTVLSVAENTTQEQSLKNQAFSMLLSWFFNICEINSDSANLYTSISTDSISNQKIVHTFTQEVATALRNYCIRLMEQSERSPTLTSNIEVQKACLVEALALLNLICMADPDQLTSALTFVRRLYGRNVVKQPNYQDIAVLVAAAQFLIRHSNTLVYKMDDIGQYLFKDVISMCYHDNASSFEIIKFIQDNLARLCYHSSLLEQYYPSLLKIVAWNPSVFESDYLHILPSFLSPNTAIEVFHSLIDLPCLTGSLILLNASQKKIGIGGEATNINSIDPGLLQLFEQPEYQAMFNFVLRPVGGVGHTFDRLQHFHQAISKLSNHPRVQQSAKTAIPLLRSFFDVFIQFADTGMTSLLFPAILERLTVIYPVPNFEEEVQSVLADTMLDLLEKHPSVVLHLQGELVDYISKVQNATDAKYAFTNLVWAIGEFLNITFIPDCKPDSVSAYYDGLECLIYEMFGKIQELKGLENNRLICVVLTTLAELATRCQDLLPRAILCISKIGQKLMTLTSGNESFEIESDETKYRKIAISRVRELLAILGTPNVASLVLSPSKNIYSARWHKDVTSLPITLKTIVALTDDE